MIRSVFRAVRRGKRRRRDARYSLVVFFKKYITSLYLGSSLPRYNKGKKSRGGVVGGIWSVFDAERDDWPW